MDDPLKKIEPVTEPSPTFFEPPHKDHLYGISYVDKFDIDKVDDGLGILKSKPETNYGNTHSIRNGHVDVVKEFDKPIGMVKFRIYDPDRSPLEDLLD